MRVRLTVDGTPREVEVDLAGGVVRMDGTSLPFRVVETRGKRTVLELDGVPVTVEGWEPPEGTGEPFPVIVDREQYRVELLSLEGAGGEGIRAAPTVPSMAEARLVPTSAPTPSSQGGVPVRPPMPGKVLEVRVHEGDKVVRGQPLLVLEAMKMRNEVVSPADGLVRSLRAAPGLSVKAKDVLLRIEPEGARTG